MKERPSGLVLVRIYCESSSLLLSTDITRLTFPHSTKSSTKSQLEEIESSQQKASAAEKASRSPPWERKKYGGW